MNTWRVTFALYDENDTVIGNVTVKVNSNNEYCARESAKRKFLMQYHNLKYTSYKIATCKMDKTYFKMNNFEERI